MTARKNILVDAREWAFDRMTGIGRMLAGCVEALAESSFKPSITLAVSGENAIPIHLKDKKYIACIKISEKFLKSELVLSGLTRRRFDVFISPYPKLPLFGVFCPCVHTIHDVLDLTDPLYRNRLKTLFDKYRLKKALYRADLSWYDSHWSMEETERLLRKTGKNPRFRHLGVDDRFSAVFQDQDTTVLKKYGLQTKGYILIVGNGLPHKNLGLLLSIADRISRKLFFVGVSKHNQSYWEKRYPTKLAAWIEQATEYEIPALLRHAFCLAQPSLTEGYGYPPLEAMACGTPALISDIAVLVETTGGHAVPCDPHNGKSWIEAYQLLENETEYNWQVQKGLQWAENLKGHHGWEKHLSDIEELLRRT